MDHGEERRNRNQQMQDSEDRVIFWGIKKGRRGRRRGWRDLYAGPLFHSRADAVTAADASERCPPSMMVEDRENSSRTTA